MFSFIMKETSKGSHWKQSRCPFSLAVWQRMTVTNLYIYFICGIWCVADVSSVSPSSEQTASLSDEGLTLETSATHHIPQAKNIPYQPLLIKPTFSLLANTEKQFFSKLVFQCMYFISLLGCICMLYTFIINTYDMFYKFMWVYIDGGYH